MNVPREPDGVKRPSGPAPRDGRETVPDRPPPSGADAPETSAPRAAPGGEALPAGARVGPYRIVSPVGAGGMSRVYRAVDERLAREVALKVMDPALTGETSALRRFLREARTLAGLSHPNVVCLFEAGESPHGPYLVMEILSGETLAARIARARTLPPPEARRIVRDLAAGLAAIHARGVVHRDVKPANVLLVPGRGAVLADFGLARGGPAATAVTLPGVVFGTPEYMSPEQARGDPTDAATDVYALGIVWYEMLSGAPPFTGPTVASILRRQALDPVPTPPERDGFNAADQAILARCVAKDRAARFAHAGELLTALAGPPARRAPPRGAWRGRLATAVVAAATAAAVAAAGYAMVRARLASLRASRDRPAGRPAVLSSEEVARHLAEPNLERFLAAFTGGTLSAADAARVRADLARLERMLARLSRARAAYPATGDLSRFKIILMAARDHCLLGDPAAARSALSRAEAVAADPAAMLRLSRARVAIDELFPSGRGGR